MILQHATMVVCGQNQFTCLCCYMIFRISNDFINIFEYANEIICVSDHGSKGPMSKLSFGTIYNSTGKVAAGTLLIL